MNNLRQRAGNMAGGLPLIGSGLQSRIDPGAYPTQGQPVTQANAGDYAPQGAPTAPVAPAGTAPTGTGPMNTLRKRFSPVFGIAQPGGGGMTRGSRY